MPENNVHLPETLLTRVKTLAAESDTPVDYIIAEAVQHFLLQVKAEDARLKGPTPVT